MNTSNGDNKDSDLDEGVETSEEETLDAELSSDAIPDIGGDTMVDVTAELKVDELVAKIDAVDPEEVAHDREVRKRLEELREKQDKDLDSTFNFNLDDDV